MAKGSNVPMNVLDTHAHHRVEHTIAVAFRSGEQATPRPAVEKQPSTATTSTEDVVWASQIGRLAAKEAKTAPPVTAMVNINSTAIEAFMPRDLALQTITNALEAFGPKSTATEPAVAYIGMESYTVKQGKSRPAYSKIQSFSQNPETGAVEPQFRAVLKITPGIDEPAPAKRRPKEPTPRERQLENWKKTTRLGNSIASAKKPKGKKWFVI